MSAAGRIAVVPGVLALEPRYASLVDPVPELRAAADAARAWLAEGSPGPGEGSPGRLVALNGSARRTTSSPGPYDARAVSFDDRLFAALAKADADALAAVDQALGAELWASVEHVPELAGLLAGREWTVTVDYDEAPYGVAWWVLRYECDEEVGDADAGRIG